MTKILYFLGGSVCHQSPDRSITISGMALPFCARCTGIYIAVFLTVLYLFFQKRLGGNKPPRLSSIVFMAAGFVFLAADGLTSYAGLRQSNNVLRILSGSATGYALPVFICLAQNFNPVSENNNEIVKHFLECFGLFAFSQLFCWMIYAEVFASAGAWYAISILACLGVFLLFYLVIKMLLTFLWKAEAVCLRIISASTALGLLFVLSFLHVAIRKYIWNI